MERNMLFREIGGSNAFLEHFVSFRELMDLSKTVFYEDVIIKSNETILMLAAAYGFDPDDWRQIWNDPANVALKTLRKVSSNLRAGDKLMIPIKWRITSKTLEPTVSRTGINTFQLKATRNGRQGDRLSWVQTVYGHNQAAFTEQRLFPQFSVDLPTEDDLPFYYTNLELDNDATLENTFLDTPSRNPPTLAQGTTTWRAVMSLCVFTNKRVSIWDTIVWGIDFGVDGVNKKFDIRPATKEEIEGHMNLLRRKTGRSNVSYQNLGWSFRSLNR
jgi:hypothetical protein